MKAGILAGGNGGRVSEETDVKPKPTVEIGGRPVLWRIMKHYAKQPFRGHHMTTQEMHDNTGSRCTIVIPTYNRPEYLKRTRALCSRLRTLDVDDWLE